MIRAQSLAALFHVALFRAVAVLFLALFHAHAHVRARVLVLVLVHVALCRGHVDRGHAIKRKTFFGKSVIWNFACFCKTIKAYMYILHVV